MTIDEMNEFEAIRQLKARYFRLMDTQQWEPWRECFTEDVHAFYEGVPRASADLPLDIGCEGRPALVDGVSALEALKNGDVMTSVVIEGPEE